MNYKKILAGTLAGAMVLSMGTFSFADDTDEGIKSHTEYTMSETTKNEKDEDILATLTIPMADYEGYTSMDISFVFPEGSWGGGCVGYNSKSAADPSNAWTSSTWENGKTEKVTVDLTDVDSDIQVQNWWISPATELKVIVDAEGPELVPGEDTGNKETVKADITADEPAVINVGAADASSFPVVPSAALTVLDKDAVAVTITALYKDEVAYNDWCGHAIAVTRPLDGTSKIYGFGGKEVSWNASLMEDKDEVVPKAGDENFFYLEEGTGTFTVPARLGDIILVYDLCYMDEKTSDHMVMSFTSLSESDIKEMSAVSGVFALEPVESETEYPIVPGYEYTVQNDDTTALKVDVAYLDKVAYNSYCGNAVVVNEGGGVFRYYGFGGKDVTWNASLYAKDDEVVTAYSSADYFELDENGIGTFVIPVKKGDIVSFYDLCWLDEEYNDLPHMVGAVTETAEDVKGEETGNNAPLATLALIAVLGLGVMAVSRKRA